MPKRDRGAGFAVVTGLFACSVAALLLAGVFDAGRSKGKAEGEYVANSDAYAAHAKQEIERCGLGSDPAINAICVAGVVKATNENERAEADLVAQSEMALWARWMLIVTTLATLLTGIGVLFVRRSLTLNREAIAAALAAVNVTREIGERQIRAYLSAVDAVGTNFAKEGVPDLALKIINPGQSPARNCKVMAAVFLAHFGGDDFFVKIPAPPNARSKSEIAAGGGVTINRKLDPLSERQIDDLRSGYLTVVFAGYVVYQDVFRKTRRLTFKFESTPLTAGGNVVAFRVCSKGNHSS